MLRDVSGLGGIYYLMLVRTLLSKDAGVSRGFLDCSIRLLRGGASQALPGSARFIFC